MNRTKLKDPIDHDENSVLGSTCYDVLELVIVKFFLAENFEAILLRDEIFYALQDCLCNAKIPQLFSGSIALFEAPKIFFQPHH